MKIVGFQDMIGKLQIVVFVVNTLDGILLSAHIAPVVMK